MANASKLLDHLSALTAIRDLELLEFSLLKTLHHSFQPLGLALLRLDATGQPQMEIVHDEGRCTVKREVTETPADLRGAFEHMKATEAPEYVIHGQGNLKTVYALHMTRTSQAYLVVTTAAELSRLDAHLVAGMLKIYANFCHLLRDSQTDQLTGLCNRKTFEECIHKLHDLTLSTDGPLRNERRSAAGSVYWLAMVDIDHFKKINDRFGHLYGDEVLVLLAQMMKTAFRDDDFVFRFGGEEFVLLLCCPDQQTCRQVLERFCRQVAERNFPQIDKVTISIGATKFVPQTFATTLLDYADQALYFSKHNGRNQVTLFEDMLATGIATQEEVREGSLEIF